VHPFLDNLFVKFAVAARRNGWRRRYALAIAVAQRAIKVVRSATSEDHNSRFSGPRRIRPCFPERLCVAGAKKAELWI
jgi:hypothetical protein